jgi:hypothetical protein
MPDYTELAIAGVGTVIWYLLQEKDKKQGEDIKMLFEKHELDALALEALKLKLAENHYPKHEMDAKFNALETATREGFAELSRKFDKVSDILIDHISKEGK